MSGERNDAVCPSASKIIKGKVSEQESHVVARTLKDHRRHFNDAEREAILLLSGGVCEICGDNLTDDWQPDHKLAFARGGITAVENGQACCKSCNQKKGAR